MRPKLDITGEKFGNLTAIRFVGLNKFSKSLFECECVCGNTVISIGSALKSGTAVSCGCSRVRNFPLKPIDPGSVFGKLKVLHFQERKRADNGTVLSDLYSCICDCGKLCPIDGDRMLSGMTKSCGCLHKEALSVRMFGKPSKSRKLIEPGTVFCRLTVLYEAGKNSNRQINYLCLCECGEIKEVSGQHLRNGKVQSCGCFRREQQIKSVTKHGKSRTREYGAARSARRRAQKIINGGSHSPEEAEFLRFELQNNKCFYCQIELTDKVHKDHKLPISRGGSNSIENIAITCVFCNLHKSDKTDEEFISILQREAEINSA